MGLDAARDSRCQVRSQRSVVCKRRVVVPRLAQNHTAHLRRAQQVGRRWQLPPTKCCISMLSVMLRDHISRNVNWHRPYKRRQAALGLVLAVWELVLSEILRQLVLAPDWKQRIRIISFPSETLLNPCGKSKQGKGGARYQADRAENASCTQRAKGLRRTL